MVNPKPIVVVTTASSCNSTALIFNVEYELIKGDSEQYSEPSHFKENYYDCFSEKMMEMRELAQKIWQVNGVTLIHIERYSITVQVGAAFKHGKLRKPIIKIIEEYLRPMEVTQQIIRDVVREANQRKK